MVATDTRPPRPAATPRGGDVGAPPPRRRRRPTELTSEDRWTAVGCAASSTTLTWLLFARLTDGAGWFGFLLVTYAVFLLLYALGTTDRLGRLAGSDRVATVAVTTATIILFVPLLWLVGYVVKRGVPALRLTFFTEDLAGIGGDAKATDGGGRHAIIGTLQQVGLALVFTVPLAVSCAVFLNESRSRFRKPVRIFVDAMSGLPSIVAGLFVFAVFIIPFADRRPIFGWQLFGYNGLMASLALSMIMIPTVTRTVDVVLRLVPDGLREAGLALGASRARVVWSVVLPTARSGVTTAVVLGIARAVGETAPLLFTSFGFDLTNTNPFDGPQESLPLFVFKNVQKPSQASIDRGFAGALVLMIVVLTLFFIARVIGRDRTSSRRLGLLRRLRIRTIARSEA
jgi:phosphate transport system permease protein